MESTGRLTKPTAPRLSLDRIDTPIGEALLVFDGEGALRALDWSDHEDRMRLLLRRHYRGLHLIEPGAAPTTLRGSIEAYFSGDLSALDGIPCATGGTPFQQRVWTALRDIPAGQTTTYGQLAERLGLPLAARAVGLANGANPVGVVLPCHRVIGKDGSLTGYGGGLERKRWLLSHEGALHS